MSRIQTMTGMVFYAPTKRRRYLSLTAAADGEAAALIAAKYPKEAADYHEGMMTYPGFHWREDERLVRVHKRLSARIRRQSKTKEPTHAPE